MIEAELPDGRIVEFPDGTDPAVMQAAVKKLLAASQPEPSMGDNILGGLEAAGTVASGIIAEPVAGVAGIAQSLNPFAEQGAGARAVEDVRGALTYEPRTEEGKQSLQSVGSALAPIGKALEGTEDFLGEATLDATGSPALAAGAATIPTAIMELIGVGALRKLRVGTRLIDDAGMPTKILRKQLDKSGLNYDNLTDAAKAEIPAIADQSFITSQSLVPKSTERALVRQIKSGGRDDALAGLRVVRNKVVPDPSGVESLRQGYAPGFVQSVKTATPETRAQMGKMLNISRKIKGQERLSLDMRPGDVVGESVTKRVKVIRNAANDARKELDTIAKNSLGNKSINMETIANPLSDALDDLGIVLREGDAGKPIVDFSDSIITKDRGSQRAIKDAIDLLSDAQNRGGVSALDAHKLKRQLDNIIDFNKKASTGLGEDGRKVLKKIRGAINESVREVDPDYARVNDVMSKSLTALDDFDKATGAAIDVFGKGADSAIGTKMRGLMSNIQSRVNLENAVNQLDDVASDLSGPRKNGVAVYDGIARKPKKQINLNDDIKDLAMFANAMDARFGAVAKSSFQGNMEQAINRVLNQGVSQEIFQQGAGAAAKAANKVRGVNEFNAFEAMDALIKKGNK